MASVASEFMQAEADLKKAHDRQVKAERTKHIGDPIEVKGKIIRMVVRGEHAWTAESGSVARRVDLQTGKTLQIFYGHSAPVTCLTFHEIKNGTSSRTVLITGSWDKTIKVWDISTKSVISSTLAHNDFIKSLVVIPSLNILASGSSDKTVKLWDLTVLSSNIPLADRNDVVALPQISSLSAHTRPVDCLAVDLDKDVSSSVTFYSGDSMGVIKAWSLDHYERPDGSRSVRGTVTSEYRAHRTGVGELRVFQGRIWSASTDCTVMIQSSAPNQPMSTPTITHNAAVRCLLPLAYTPLAKPYLLTGSGDLIKVWDVTSFGEPEGEVNQLAQVDVHSHDVTALGTWVRSFPDEPGRAKEAWIVSGSLDGTLRRWKLEGILKGEHNRLAEPEETKALGALTEEEERELAELLDD